MPQRGDGPQGEGQHAHKKARQVSKQRRRNGGRRAHNPLLKSHLHDDSVGAYVGGVEAKSFASLSCPVARALEQVGPWWDLLIIRNVFLGVRRFSDLQLQLGIVPTTLNRRLSQLCDHHILQRRRYQTRPPRYEYHLTEKGATLLPVLVSLLDWGNRWLAEEGRSVVLTDRETGAEIQPVLVDARTGKTLSLEVMRLSAGPAADERMRELLDAHAASQ